MGLANTPWPKYHHDNKNTGQSQYPSSSDGTLKWSYLTGEDIDSSPAISLDGTIYVGSYDNYLYALNPDGTLKWRYLTGGAVTSSPAISLDGTIYVGSWDFYLYVFGSTPAIFEVVSTVPTQDADNVDPNTEIQITFSDSLDTATVSSDTLQVYGWLPDQYEYSWTYDDDTKTLTLTIPGGLETNAPITVNLTDGLKSISEITLTPYALGFSTAKLPLQCDPPVFIEPATARCAKPICILQSSTPSRARAKWRLHFRIQAYADQEGTQLISTVDSSTNPELFEYSTDAGLNWREFPIDGLPKEQYGTYIAARCEVGPRKQVWLKASVGAEDA